MHWKRLLPTILVLLEYHDATLKRVGNLLARHYK